VRYEHVDAPWHIAASAIALAEDPSNMNNHADLRLFVDGAIMKPQLGGIATYISELTNALARHPNVEVCIATSTTAELALPSSVQVIHLPASVQQFARRLIWRERRLGALVSAWNANVVLAPTVELPLRALPVPAVMVMHDLGAVQAPDLYGRLRWLRFATGVPLACRRADHVVCVSHATLAALRDSFPSYADSCTVIGEAGRVLPVRPRTQRAFPYILVVGAMLPHKNVQTLVKAMHDPTLGDVELIVAGPIDDRQRRRFADWGGTTSTPSRIRHLGYVDAELLAELYAGAAVVALPSLYEGFGLTLLEAMKCGVPAVASSIPAHREVGGDAAIYVEQPLSPRAWAQALARVISDRRLGEALSREARVRASGITWDTIAEQMVALTRDIVAAHT
jgi:glycosyltransferase involved in cell wall biosynthesis